MAFTPQQRLEIIKAECGRMQHDACIWNKHRRWYQSQFWPRGAARMPDAPFTDESGEDLLETNYAYAFIDTMIANTCPQNPQVTLWSTQGAPPEVTAAREALVNEALRLERFGETLRSVAISASLYPRGVVKVVWDDRLGRPKFREIDPRRFFFDRAAERWDEIRYAVEVVTIPVEVFKARTKERHPGGRLYSNTKAIEAANPNSYPRWLYNADRAESYAKDAARDVFKWVTIYEFYDFTANKFFHLLDNTDEPLLAGDLPYASVPNPFKLLTFNANKEDMAGMSDIQLIAPLQEQLNELDSIELNYYKANLPVAMVNTAALEEPDSFKDGYANSSQPGSFIDAKLRQNLGPMGLDQVVRFTPTPTLPLGFAQKRDEIVRRIEFILGIPQYSRGVVGVADVATEVALSDAATRTRNGVRQERNNDVIRWAGESADALFNERWPDAAILHVRPAANQPPVTVSREVVGMPPMPMSTFDEAGGVVEPEPLPPPDGWRFEAVPYSGIENNRLIQLKNIQGSWPMLMAGAQMGVIDVKRLFEKLTDTLMIPDVLMDGPVSPPVAADPAAADQGEDPAAAGGMPPGAVEMPLPAMPFGGPGNGGAAPAPLARGTSAFPES